MKKIILLFTAFLLFSRFCDAQQQAASSSMHDRIASLLTQMPAMTEAALNAHANKIASLGQAGIVEMLKELGPEGGAENTKLKQAISGFSFYSSRKGAEEWRRLAVLSYSSALQTVNDKENQAFIISQLQITGRDDAVPALRSFLKDERLCDPASRALVKINSALAISALLEALKKTTGTCRLSILHALGDVHAKAAVPGITHLLGPDPTLDKIILYALASIGDRSSLPVLMDAAKKAGYIYDVTDATASCLRYLVNLGRTGNRAAAIKAAQYIVARTGAVNQVTTRTNALKVLVDLQGAGSVQALILAVRNKDPQYRAAAIRFASAYSRETYPAWIAELKKAPSEEKVAILGLLADPGIRAALPAMLGAMKSNDLAVRLAAIHAAGKTGGTKVLDSYFTLLKTGGKEETAAMANSMLSMKGADLTQRIGQVLPKMPASAQIALIDVLGARAAAAQLDVVLPLLKSTDQAVQMASYSSLKNLSTEKDLPLLFAMLHENEKKDERDPVQKAIIAVLINAPDRSTHTSMVLGQLEQASRGKKSLYYPLLAAVSDKASVKALTEAFREGDGLSKKDALIALSQSSGPLALNELFRISKESTDTSMQNLSLSGYVGLLHRSELPAEQKLLFLENAMQIASNTDQKKLILQEVENAKTYPALVFAGTYIDDPQLKDIAANDVMTNAFANKNYSGARVHELLVKTMGILKGTETEYLKEAIRKYLSEMLAGDGFMPLFNGKDLTGWKGLVADPIKRSKMDAATLAAAQTKADVIMNKGWYVSDRVLNFSGEGENICTVKQYADFELYVDWKITKDGDAGIYLRGSPQVQIWDTSRINAGAQVGSGGLYNNKTHESKPLKLADNAIGEWNNFHILMKGERVTVYLNGVLVVKNTILENYWDYSLPIFTKEQIELQAHGTHVWYRNIYLKELDGTIK